MLHVGASLVLSGTAAWAFCATVVPDNPRCKPLGVGVGAAVAVYSWNANGDHTADSNGVKATTGSAKRGESLRGSVENQLRSRSVSFEAIEIQHHNQRDDGQKSTRIRVRGIQHGKEPLIDLDLSFGEDGSGLGLVNFHDSIDDGSKVEKRYLGRP